MHQRKRELAAQTHAERQGKRQENQAEQPHALQADGHRLLKLLHVQADAQVPCDHFLKTDRCREEPLFIAQQVSLRPCARFSEHPVIDAIDRRVRNQGILDQIAQQYIAPLIEALATLKSGALTLSVPSTSPAAIDSSLIFWSSSDRAIAVLTGYIALAMLAALYVAADTPITTSPTGQRHEKVIRDTLRQAGGVLKVILIISIEMLVFPRKR